MGKKNVLTIRIPEELKYRLDRVADDQGVSLNQLALYAFTKEVSELEMHMYFRDQLGGKSREQIIKNFDEVFLKIKDREPIAGDIAIS